MDENKKATVEIGTSLSSSLMNASLTMLTILAALFVFIIEKRETTILYYILSSLSFIAFVVSIYFGGKGINKARENLYFGNYSSKKTKPCYNYQAIFCLLGITLALTSIFFTKADISENKEIEDINNNLLKLIKIEERKIKIDETINSKLKKLEERIEKIEKIEKTKTSKK